VDNVHDLAHIVGNSLYEKFGIYGVTHCDAAFAYGCFHGVTQAMLIKGGPGGVKGIEAECTRIFPPNVSSNWTGCIHGLGHGLLSWASLDVAKALAECDTLDSIHRPYCYDGVFMENAEGAPLSDLRPDRPWAFCENFSETYHYNCARYQTPLLMQRFHWDDKTTAESCTLTDDPTLQRGCVETFGHIAAQRNFTSAAGIAAMCGLLSSEETEALCIINAVRELHFQKYQGASLVGEQLCATISLTKRAECYNENR
jgi:hypothetical protein